ncbi:MAG: CADD family putative folate metabolism protein [Bacteroidetes bacterium]|nr:CADD family putative folate metabolism protein [Bacteroidota bacterium]
METTFTQKINSTIEQNKMLNHPFYVTWNEGKLSKEALQEYAKQYYHFMMEFPTFISAIHSNTPSLKIRQQLLENLMEEENGNENHPSLWVKFCNSLGVTEDDAKNTKLFPETETTLKEFRRLSRSENFQEGVAALYAYESQIPEVAKVKIDGLKNFYGINSEDGLKYFSVHEVADIQHSDVQKNILKENVSTSEMESKTIKAAKDSCLAINTFLDGIYNRYCTSLN